jgi:hypothetical protein
VALAPVDQRRVLDGADVLRLPAPRPEVAARGRVGRRGQVALQDDPRLGAAQRRLVRRDRRQQRLRVRVRRALVDVGVGAVSMIRPRYMTLTRSLMCRTTDRSCAMNRYDRPNSSCRSSSRLITWACTDTSSADTGSSHTMTSGRRASARAMPMRWR